MIQKNNNGEVVSISLDEEDFRRIIRNGQKGIVFLGLMFPPGMLWQIPITRLLFLSQEQAVEFQVKVQHHYICWKN